MKINVVFTIGLITLCALFSCNEVQQDPMELAQIQKCKLETALMNWAENLGDSKLEAEVKQANELIQKYAKASGNEQEFREKLAQFQCKK
ncbi:MAG TPA: hypothetical protein ENJ82_17915 [Bacteroidetes bacterium]|nr:hypothetical protein [Bacteroidota bacterium]